MLPKPEFIRWVIWSIQDGIYHLLPLSASCKCTESGWAFSNDREVALGFIWSGICDDAVSAQIEAFSNVGDILSKLGMDGDFQELFGMWIF